jgi:hypothetical protein
MTLERVPLQPGLPPDMSMYVHNREFNGTESMHAEDSSRYC